MIKIVTDSDSNLPPEVLAEYDIAFAPIHIIFGDEVLRERVDLSDEEAYERISAAAEHPTTSQPSPGDFKAVYEEVLGETPGATILSIHVSGPLSGTIESARQAAAMLPDADIRTFDTLSASHGQGLMVVQAARMAGEGATVEDIFAYLERMREGMEVRFVLSTLEYLARGGRIGKARHLMGNLLDIKPILMVKDGVIDAHSRQRTWKKAVAAIREMVLEAVRGQADGTLFLGVIHALSEDEARDLLASLEAELEVDVKLFGQIGPGLGVHTGPGSLGVCWVFVGEEVENGYSGSIMKSS